MGEHKRVNEICDEVSRAHSVDVVLYLTSLYPYLTPVGKHSHSKDSTHAVIPWRL
jgi:hypothetical protein